MSNIVSLLPGLDFFQDHFDSQIMKNFFQIISFAVLLVPGVGFAQIDLTNGLLGYYTFNDGTATDLSGNGYDGMVNGMAPINGRLLIPENDSSRVNLPAEVFTGLEDLAICFAVEFDTFHTGNCIQTPTNTVMGASSNFEENELVIAYVANTKVFEVTIGGQKYSVSNVQLELHKQYCVVITRQNTLTRIYIDGDEVGQGGILNWTTFVESNHLILGQEQDCLGGCFLTCQSLSGNLDEVRFYNRALSVAEVGAYCQVVYTIIVPAKTEKSVAIIPNPVKDIARVDLGDWQWPDVQVDVMNINGQICRTFILSNQDGQQIDLSGLPSGVYSLLLSSPGDVRSARLVHVDE